MKTSSNPKFLAAQAAKVAAARAARNLVFLPTDSLNRTAFVCRDVVGVGSPATDTVGVLSHHPFPVVFGEGKPYEGVAVNPDDTTRYAVIRVRPQIGQAELWVAAGILGERRGMKLHEAVRSLTAADAAEIRQILAGE
jgi:hypothetical protein